MQIDANTPADVASRFLIEEFGTLETFLDDLGEETPTETADEAASLVNSLIGTDGVGTDERLQDLLTYAVHAEPNEVTWFCYISDARDAE